MAKVSKISKALLGVAIAFLSVFFVAYAVYLFYDEPELTDYCKDIRPFIQVNSCENYSINQTDDRFPQRCSCFEVDQSGNKRCEAPNPAYNDCNSEYEDARETHSRTSFIILVVVGLILILFGGLKSKVEVVRSGVMGGGVLTLLYAAIRYWGSIQDYARLIILGIALFLLIWIGYKKFKE